MTVSFSINGLPLSGVQCEWRQVAIQTDTDNQQLFSPFAVLTMNVGKMLSTPFVSIRKLRGQVVTLVANDIDDMNAERTYTNAVLESVDGFQFGHLIQNINLAFRVEVV